jgi:hypothetical protein
MSISASDVERRGRREDWATFDGLASEVAAICDEAIASGNIDALSNEALGQIFASAVRLYAAKAETGAKLQPFGRNTTSTPTEIAIACLAMLDAGSMEVFELGLWDTMTNIRPARRVTLIDS